MKLYSSSDMLEYLIAHEKSAHNLSLNVKGVFGCTLASISIPVLIHSAFPVLCTGTSTSQICSFSFNVCFLLDCNRLGFMCHWPTINKITIFNL